MTQRSNFPLCFAFLQPFSKVWHQIKLEDFSKWYSSLKSSSVAKGTDSEADVYAWEFTVSCITWSDCCSVVEQQELN